jgi:hypothetical protein
LDGYEFIMGEDETIDLTMSWTDSDTLDSHSWSFYSSGGEDFNSWITTDAGTDDDGNPYSQMYIDLTNEVFEDKIAFPVPWTMEARLTDDNFYGSANGALSCSVYYEIEIYPRFGYKTEFDDDSVPVNEILKYRGPSNFHDDPEDELLYFYTL